MGAVVFRSLFSILSIEPVNRGGPKSLAKGILMTRLKNRLILAAVFALLVFAGTVALSRRAIAQNPNPGSAPVNLVAPLPLPVTGTVAVNPAQLPLPVTGTVTVNPAQLPLPITGTVSINNLQKPFQKRLCVAHDVPCGGLPDQFIAGSQGLVIEQVAGRCVTTGSVALLELSLSSAVDGANWPHTLQILNGVGNFGAPVSGQAFYVVSQQTKIYADPSSTVRLIPSFSGPTGVSFLCALTLSGHTGTP
jgi:hypothetical protein